MGAHQVTLDQQQGWMERAAEEKRRQEAEIAEEAEKHVDYQW